MDMPLRPRHVLGILLSLAILIAGGDPASAQSVYTPPAWPDKVPIPRIKPGPKNPEIVGGKPSVERQAVGIHFKDAAGVDRICSGLWLSTDYVLTAAHCTCHNGPYAVMNEDRMNQSTAWKSATLASRFSSRICAGQPSNGDDVALLKLDAPLTVAGSVPTCTTYNLIPRILMAGTWMANPPRAVTVAGYGFDGNLPGSQGLRRQADLRVATMICRLPIERSFGCQPLREFILGAGRPADGADSCAGDSGGPAFLRRRGEFVPLGLVSRGLPVAQPARGFGNCGAGGIYTYLGRRDILKWLTSVTEYKGGAADCGPAVR